MSRITEWAKLPVALTELCLATTLRCGQSFRWRQGEDDIWSCSLRGRIVQLTQDDTHLKYRSIWPMQDLAPPTPPSSNAAEPTDDTKALIHHYLNLEPNLKDLYQQWSSSDANFRKKAPKFTGVRILKQDAWEALMVDKLCTHYGDYVATWNGKPYYDFPPPDALSGASVENHLRELGFGYRAKYIAQTARIVSRDRETGWLDSLRNPESPAYGYKASPGGVMRPEGREGYREAHEKLLELQGVGPKVADCVCLMGLGWGEAVPIDTHIWQIAERDYKFRRGKNTSMNKAYDAVANHFRRIWGKEAGWAHSVLFTADLRVFAERLTAKAEVKEEVGVDADEKTVTTEVRKVSVKREVESDEKGVAVSIDNVTMTSSEHVKRRRRG